jgi:hypothetical protein
LDEGFGLAVGGWGVDAGALVGDAEMAADVREVVGVEAGSVVGEHTPCGDAEALEVGHGCGQEAGGGVRLFVRVECGVGDAGVIIDGDVEELPACSTSLVPGVAGDAMAGLDDAGELLDVDVQQVAGRVMLVA